MAAIEDGLFSIDANLDDSSSCALFDVKLYLLFVYAAVKEPTIVKAAAGPLRLGELGLIVLIELPSSCDRAADCAIHGSNNKADCGANWGATGSRTQERPHASAAKTPSYASSHDVCGATEATQHVAIFAGQAERIRERDRISASVTVQIDATGEPDRILRQIAPDRPRGLRSVASNPLRFFSLAAELLQFLIVI